MADGIDDIAASGTDLQAGCLSNALFDHGVEEHLDAVGRGIFADGLGRLNAAVLCDLDAENIHRFGFDEPHGILHDGHTLIGREGHIEAAAQGRHAIHIPALQRLLKKLQMKL